MKLATQRVSSQNGKVKLKHPPDDIDRAVFDPGQTTALNPILTTSNQLYLGQSSPRIHDAKQTLGKWEGKKCN